MYAVVKAGIVTKFAGKPSLAQMQEAVEGLSCSAISFPRKRSGITVDIFVNDEGLLIGQVIHYRRTADGSPLAGPLLVTASNLCGETVAADDDDLSRALCCVTLLDQPLVAEW